MSSWYFAQIIFEMFMIIFASSFQVGILLPWRVDQSHVGNMFINFLIGEIASKMGIPQRIVIGKGYLADVVCRNEWFLVFAEGLIVSLH